MLKGALNLHVICLFSADALWMSRSTVCVGALTSCSSYSIVSIPLQQKYGWICLVNILIVCPNTMVWFVSSGMRRTNYFLGLDVLIDLKLWCHHQFYHATACTWVFLQLQPTRLQQIAASPYFITQGTSTTWSFEEGVRFSYPSKAHDILPQG